MSLLPSSFGHFRGDGRAYVITDPHTPTPWVNVIANERYGLVISQHGGGFSWLEDSQHNVLTRWEMDLVRDCHGKFLYLADLESGAVWSAAPAPCLTAHDEYECEHRPGATRFRTAAEGIRTEWTLGVAAEDAVEVWGVALTNLTDRPRKVRVSSYLEWCCGVAPDSKREFHRLFFNTRYDAKRRAAVATKNMWPIPPKSEREHWNVPWPYVAAHAVGGVEFERPLAMGDKAAFLGRYGTTASPAALRSGSPANGGFGRFGDACAALGGDLTIAPGATVRLHYLLAISESDAGTMALLDKYSDERTARGAIAAAEEAWERRLGVLGVQSEREDVDLMVNTWLPYQAVSGRLWARTGYYQQSGARGFRDQLQDSQVWLPYEPSRTLDQLLLHATRQFADGSVNHWWHALADFGNHTACSDDYLWLPFVMASYLRETGDFAALERTAPFRDDPTAATLLEHCLRSFGRAFARTSPRGIPLIGSCDWNDGLSAMGIEEKGESAWLGMFLAYTLGEWGVILDRLGRGERAAEFRARREGLIAAINAHAWDGEWYRYGTKDSGEWIGASACAEGRIHLNAQTWAIWAGVAPASRATAAWNSVKQHLLSPYGPLLLSPAYTVPDATIGYVTRYAPGSRENGGVYMHAATWALAAAAMQGDVQSVGRIWESISPPARGRDAARYWAEPYVTPGNVDGPLSDLPGRAGWTWYTGSAAWLHRVACEWMLGVRPTWEGLLVSPCPPAWLGRVAMSRTWGGARLSITFDAREYVAGRPAVLEVRGREIVGGLIPREMVGPGEEIAVRVTWPHPGSIRSAPEAALRSIP